MLNKFTLLGKGGGKNDCLIELPDRPLGIGTDPNNCSIIYSQKNNDISAFHCQLVPQQGGWTIADYSDKGTWLNGKKMTPYQAYPLKPGDVFYLANLKNSFYFSIANATNSPQGQGQVQSPQWSPQGQGQMQSPQWLPQGQGQMQSPQWLPQGQGQVQSPQSKWLDIKQKFFTYKGRLNRKPYNLRVMPISLFIGFYSQLLIELDKIPYKEFCSAIGVSEETGVWVGIIMILVWLISTIGGGISIYMNAIRRLHDLNKSGWFTLLMIIPIVGFFFGWYLILVKGTTGSNRYGSDPLA